MTRLLLAALAVIATAAAPTYAQSTPELRLFQLPPIDAPPTPRRYDFDPALEARPPARPKGARMLVGTEVAPGTLMGVGLFTANPKQRGTAQERFDHEPRKSRKLGFGLLMKF